MLRIVLPSVTNSLAAVGVRGQRGRSIANIAAVTAASYRIRRAVADVVTVEIVVVVDVDVVATPPATPAPTAAPECSHQYAKAEGNRHARRIVPPRRIVNGRIGIVRRTVDYDRIIGKARTQLAGWLAR